MIRGKGTGFVKTIDSDEDLLIERENLGFALDGDIVEVTLKPEVTGKRREAKVTKVIERSFRELIGVVKEGFVAGKKQLYFSPDNHRIHVRPILPDATGNDMGMKVAVEIASWTSEHTDPVGTITEIHDYLRLLWARIGDIGDDVGDRVGLGGGRRADAVAAVERQRGEADRERVCRLGAADDDLRNFGNWRHADIGAGQQNPAVAVHGFGRARQRRQQRAFDDLDRVVALDFVLHAHGFRAPPGSCGDGAAALWLRWA